MSKPGKVLKAMCKKLGVRLTIKRGQKRVYKSVKVLKRQCVNKKKRVVKKKMKVKRRKARFGAGRINFNTSLYDYGDNIVIDEETGNPMQWSDRMSEYSVTND